MFFREAGITGIRELKFGIRELKFGIRELKIGNRESG